jgi:hypothetical protein
VIRGELADRSSVYVANLPSTKLAYDDLVFHGIGGNNYLYTVRAVLSERTATSSHISAGAQCVLPPPVLTLSASLKSCDAGSNTAVVHLAWNDIGGTYMVLRDDEPIAQASFLHVSYDDTTALPGHTYTYRVDRTSSPTGPVSNLVPLTTCPIVTLPDRPSVTATTECSGAAAYAHLTWPAAARASSYVILRNGSQVGVGTSTTFDDPNVVPNQTYSYVVRALGASGGTADSAAANVPVAPCIVPHADLAALNVALSRASIEPGNALGVTFSLSNIGDRIAPATTSRFRIGSGTQPQPGDVLLAELSAPPIAAGATAPQSTTAFIPSPFAAGTFYIFVSIDDDHTSDDVNLTNNVARSSALQVMSAQPCVLSCAASAPKSAMIQQPVTMVLTSFICPNSTIMWDFGDTSISIASAAVSHTYSQPGTYRWVVRINGGEQSCETSGTIDVAAPQPARRRGAHH